MMAILSHVFLTLIVCVSTNIVFGQVDSTETKKGINKLDEDFAIRWETEQKRLRTAFYNSPKYFQLTYAKNGVKQKLDGARFSISINGKEREIKPDSTSYYPMNFSVDTSQIIQLKLAVNGILFEQQLSRSAEIANGATIIFGLITKAPKKKRINKNSQVENTQMDETYFNWFSDTHKMIRASRKKKNTKYLVVNPRVFGCGMSCVYFR